MNALLIAQDKELTVAEGLWLITAISQKQNEAQGLPNVTKKDELSFELSQMSFISIIICYSLRFYCPCQTSLMKVWR